LPEFSQIFKRKMGIGKSMALPEYLGIEKGSVHEIKMG